MFPFLIGRMLTGLTKLIDKKHKDKFPFLIGRMLTHLLFISQKLFPGFPFLIGRMLTFDRKGEFIAHFYVSIPYR